MKFRWSVFLGATALWSITVAAAQDQSPPPAPTAQAERLPSKIGETWTNSIGMKLAFIPAGTFVMGSPATEEGRWDDEAQHKVMLTRSFLMGTTTVTQAQWKAVMDNNPSYFQEAVIHAKFPDVWKSLMANVAIDNLPVETVSWNDAVDFCKRLGAKEGRHYRLPTDAEWEYACRAGTTTTYNTGDGEAALASAGWYSGNTRIPGLRDRSKIT